MKISKKLILSFLAVASISILLGSMITFSGSIIIGLVVIVIDIGIVFGLAKFVTGNIVSPLQQAIQIIGEIGSGDTSGSMLMGKAVNCSSFKQCDETSCPSYGKEDHCWVSSGSFAVVKSCPRALKGEDCRTCEIYGAHTEMEELGSTIGALVNYFEERKNLALEIANGDLTKEVKLASEKDSLGKAFQIMINSLKKIIDGVQTASEQIVTGSVQLSSSSQSLSQGASQQAATLEEISSSMFEIGSRANTSNENASQAQMLSNQALDQVKQGNKQMESMLQSMQEIKNTSSSVTKVIKVIDEIAFQTNLLALNAAVEAARAGKYGKGFAVVAEEVRNLAGRSAKAAKETNEMIEKSIKEVENGVKRTDETAAVLEGINAGVEKVNDLVAEIAAASQEQNNNLQEINKGLSSMNDVVQHNSSVAEETAAASEDLSSQARNLQVDLNRFKLKQKIAASEQRGKIPQPVIKSFQSTAPQVTLKQQGKRPQPVIKSLQSPAPKLESQEQVAKKPKRVILLDDDEFGKY